MPRLIKKYKNRRLYDTEISQYITIENLQGYVVDNISFKIEDSNGIDITSSVLLQILVEMEAGTSQFLSPDILRQIICLANHPMHQAYKSMMEQMFTLMDKPLQDNPYEEATKVWTQHMQNIMDQWQSFFKKT